MSRSWVAGVLAPFCALVWSACEAEPAAVTRADGGSGASTAGPGGAGAMVGAGGSVGGASGVTGGSGGVTSGSGGVTAGSGGVTSGSGGVTGGSGGVTGGSAGSGGVGGAGGIGEDAPTSAVAYTASDANLLNPERGFYATADLATVRNLSSVRSGGKSIVHAAAHLDRYLGANHAQDLPQALFADLASGFSAMRQAGVKAIVRFQYDDGEGYPGGANDATESWMIRHVQQLAPVLKSNEDVIYVVDAGLIGAWGEWHTSKNFSDGPSGQGPRKNVFDALLAAVPSSRRVALRYPAYKRMFYGMAATLESQLLAGSDIARAAHHNDCFLSSVDDVGTYQYEPIDVLKTYLADDTKYVPIGGETCAVHARNACATATAEMQRFHYAYLNAEYHPDVLRTWDSEGCRGEIDRKLGYRLTLRTGELPTAVRPGGSFVLALSLTNDGWAAPTNPRPVMIVLEGADRRTVQLSVDPRVWLPGSVRLTVRLRMPAGLAPGSYRLALWLPDAAVGLRARTEYSIQLANQGTWDAAHGDNTLGRITVSANAPGSADPTAQDFTLIP